ncbi:DUF3320 domain-containing protein [Nocardia sp. NPDC058640]|uniref:DUF3320 domain-containing protein n=1 Tax=Nocardia sp. NPDC058640 TaxID=3346571 RepID=UPI00364E0325
MNQVRWFGRIGWVVGLLGGAFSVLLGAVGYFSSIDDGSTFGIVLAVAFLAGGTALSAVSIWQLVIGDRRKRNFTAQHGDHSAYGYGQGLHGAAPQYGHGPNGAASEYGHGSHAAAPQQGYGQSGNTNPGAPQQVYGPPMPPRARPETPATPYPHASYPPRSSPPTPFPQVQYTPPSAPISPTVAQTPDWQIRTRTAHHWLPTGIPYVTAPTGVLGSPADLDRDSSATIPLRVRDAVRETIAVEGPIERTQLVARVAQRFGVQKPSDKQQICVLGEVPESLMRATSLGVFVWPSDLDPTTWRGFRFTPPTVSRAIDTIAAEEIVNAITQVAQHNRNTFDEIVWATLTQFAHERTGAAEDRVEACLNTAVRRGRLAKDSDGRYRALT